MKKVGFKVHSKYLTCVEHDFSFNVIALFIHHIHLLMELSAKILHIIRQNVFLSIYSHHTSFQKHSCRAQQRREFLEIS